MKSAIVFLTLALVFLAVVDSQYNRSPGVVEIKGKQSKSSSDIESCKADEKKESVKVGGVSYEQGSHNSEYNKDYDTASASENEETVDDGCGNTRKIKSKSSKTASEDVDAESSSTYKKVSY